MSGGRKRVRVSLSGCDGSTWLFLDVTPTQRAFLERVVGAELALEALGRVQE